MAGKADRGICAAAAAIWFRAIRRSAIACRSTRSPGPEADYPYVHAPDPTQAFPALPAHSEMHAQFAISRSLGLPAVSAAVSGERFAEKALERVDDALAHGADGGNESPPRAGESASLVTRTSLSAQARNGVLYIFMPPTETLEDYLELIAAVKLPPRPSLRR